MKESNGKKATQGISKQPYTKSLDTKNAKKGKLSAKDQKIKKKQTKERKAKKDPNQPKRPPTAFFLFLEEFRKNYKKEHPDVKGVSVIGKAGGDKWRSMTDADKQPYVNKALQKKSDYEKTLAAYKQNKNGDASPQESEKSKSEIHDDEEESEEEEEEE